jgi:hypothetical protein
VIPAAFAAAFSAAMIDAVSTPEPEIFPLL